MSASVIEIKDTTANPAPLGLLGFGLTTTLLNMHNAGLFGLSAMIIAMGLFYGGAAQIFVGVMEWKKNNTFGTVAFMSYGLFWISLCGIWILPKIQFGGVPICEPADKWSMAAYLGMWGVFSTGLFIGTFKLNRALQWVFGTLVLLFLLLTIENCMFALGHPEMGEMFKKIAGIEGIVCGFLAIYTGFAQILNEVYGRVLFPLGVLKPAEVKADQVEEASVVVSDPQTA
jgi:uncharacterized protein